MGAKIKLDTYSHGFIVRTKDQRGLRATLEFVRTMVQYETVKLPPYYNAQKIPVRTFAGATKDRSEIRLHINQLEDYLRHMDSYGYGKSSIQIQQHEPATYQTVDHPWNNSIEPREQQLPIIEFMSKDGQPIRVTNLQAGKGKATSSDSLVKIPDGWKTLRDIRVGDTVIAWDGSHTEVIGVFPQGEVDLFEVTFWDGRSIKVCGEHLWASYYENTSEHNRWKIRDTMMLKQILGYKSRPISYVPLINPEESADISLPIPPYMLGVLLGDGSLSSDSLEFSKGDQEIADFVESELTDGYFLSRHNTKANCFKWVVKSPTTGRNKYRTLLKDMGLLGKRSWEKFIPEEYLHGSRLQRLRLLQGLMDTDGTANHLNAPGRNGAYGSKSGTTSYCSTSKMLAEGVQYLVRSLGGIASIRERVKSYTYKGEKKYGRPAYFVNIRHKRPEELFRLPRKKERVSNDGQYTERLKLRVKSVEPIGKGEAICISIDHPDQLYVTNDFIVTHNTAVSLMSMHNISRRTLLQLKGGYIERWLPDLKELFDYDDHEIIVVRGSKALKKLIQQGKDDEISAKVIIISSKTMHGFLKEFEALGDETTYGCRPEELYSLLEIGLKIIDEVHEDYHLNYRSDIYSNVARSIHLSATLETEDPFRRMIYEIALPKRHWYTGWKYDAYCHVRALHFNIEDAERLRTSERGRDTYSHNAFEKSIMKNKTLLKNYLEFIGDIVFFDFVENFEQGQRCLIFCGMVDMVELVRDYCRSRFPDLDTTEFVAGTPANVLTQHDIIVSTVQSCGTAVDIPNLTMALLTRALNKLETNEQVKSRLRKIKDWPELVPLFNYFVCDDIPKHVSYHRDKKEQFKGKVAKHEDVYTKRLLLSSKVKHQ